MDWIQRSSTESWEKGNSRKEDDDPAKLQLDPSAAAPSRPYQKQVPIYATVEDPDAQFELPLSKPRAQESSSLPAVPDGKPRTQESRQDQDLDAGKPHLQKPGSVPSQQDWKSRMGPQHSMESRQDPDVDVGAPRIHKSGSVPSSQDWKTGMGPQYRAESRQDSDVDVGVPRSQKSGSVPNWKTGMGANTQPQYRMDSRQEPGSKLEPAGRPRTQKSGSLPAQSFAQEWRTGSGMNSPRQYRVDPRQRAVTVSGGARMELVSRQRHYPPPARQNSNPTQNRGGWGVQGSEGVRNVGVAPQGRGMREVKGPVAPGGGVAPAGRGDWGVQGPSVQQQNIDPSHYPTAKFGKDYYVLDV